MERRERGEKSERRGEMRGEGIEERRKG
jgi:hypothetical protein